jgi:hypothetical protein
MASCLGGEPSIPEKSHKSTLDCPAVADLPKKREGRSGSPIPWAQPYKR